MKNEWPRRTDKICMLKFFLNDMRCIEPTQFSIKLEQLFNSITRPLRIRNFSIKYFVLLWVELKCFSNCFLIPIDRFSPTSMPISMTMYARAGLCCLILTRMPLTLPNMWDFFLNFIWYTFFTCNLFLYYHQLPPPPIGITLSLRSVRPGTIPYLQNYWTEFNQTSFYDIT